MHPAEMFRGTLSRLLDILTRLAAELGLGDLLAVILGEADEISG